MNAPKITVVGSYATGLTMKVARLPSRGETLLGTGYRVDFGGKGSNQAVACARLGAAVSFVAKIGRDNFGEAALRLYRDEGIDVTHVTQIVDAPTGVGFIVVEAASGNNCIVIDPGANDLLTANDVSDSAAAFDSSAVVLTQLEIPVATAGAAVVHGRARGAITILNPAPVRPLPSSVLQAVDILTPNTVEAKVLAGHAPDAAITPEQVARELIRSGVKQVVMTLGENGALIVTDSSATRVAAIKVKAADTTGAGDAFNAGLAVALACGETLEDAVRFAVVTGGLAVTKEVLSHRCRAAATFFNSFEKAERLHLRGLGFRIGERDAKHYRRELLRAKAADKSVCPTLPYVTGLRILAECATSGSMDAV